MRKLEAGDKYSDNVGQLWLKYWNRSQKIWNSACICHGDQLYSCAANFYSYIFSFLKKKGNIYFLFWQLLRLMFVLTGSSVCRLEAVQGLLRLVRVHSCAGLGHPVPGADPCCGTVSVGGGLQWGWVGSVPCPRSLSCPSSSSQPLAALSLASRVLLCCASCWWGVFQCNLNICSSKTIF